MALLVCATLYLLFSCPWERYETLLKAELNKGLPEQIDFARLQVG